MSRALIINRHPSQMVKQKCAATETLQPCQHLGQAHRYFESCVSDLHPAFYFSSRSHLSRFSWFSPSGDFEKKCFPIGRASKTFQCVDVVPVTLLHQPLGAMRPSTCRQSHIDRRQRAIAGARAVVDMLKEKGISALVIGSLPKGQIRPAFRH